MGVWVLYEISEGIKQEIPFIDTDNYQRGRGMEADRRGYREDKW